MLSRTIRGMAPGGDFSTFGAPTFSDRKDISSWALDHVLFMAKLGIIKGTDGKFMPAQDNEYSFSRSSAGNLIMDDMEYSRQ